MIEIATMDEMKNNFGHYANLVAAGYHIIVTDGDREIGSFIPKGKRSLTDTLTGILNDTTDPDQALEEGLRNKYEITD